MIIAFLRPSAKSGPASAVATLLAGLLAQRSLETAGKQLSWPAMATRLKDGEIVRPVGVNRATIRALQGRGLIIEVQGEDKLTTIWRAKK